MLIEARLQHFKYLGFSKCSGLPCVPPGCSEQSVCSPLTDRNTNPLCCRESNPIIYATAAWVRLDHTEDTVEL